MCIRDRHFAVTKRDGLVIACAALLPLGDGASAELACVAVHQDYRGGGRAAALLAHLEARARRQGIASIYALTTAAPHWFIEHGFARVATDALPVARRELYNYQRNSLVLQKAIPA